MYPCIRAWVFTTVYECVYIIYRLVALYALERQGELRPEAGID